MSNSISTVKQPLKFFENLFLGGEFRELRDNFFNTWEQKSINEPDKVDINKELDLVFYTILENEDGSQLYSFDDFPNRLRIKLAMEVSSSKKLMLEGVAELIFAQNTAESYLNHQHQIIVNIINANPLLIKKYPTITKHLSTLSRFINELSANSNLDKQDPPVTDKKLVDEIFGYLRGKQDGANIMSGSEYERLINLILKMLNEQKVPEMASRFSTLPITNELLRFTFYVLHVEKYGRHRKKYILEFIKKAFSQFEGVNMKTLETKFSVPPEQLINLDWVPEIIKRHKMKK